MNRFQFKGEFPPEVKPSIMAVVSRYEYLLPSWCHHVEVYWNAEIGDESIALCETKYEYRLASITIGPLWLDRDQEERERSIEHELAHIPSMPMFQWVHGVITRIVTKEQHSELQSELLESLRVWAESSTCDLVDIMRRGGITPPERIN